MKEKSWDEIEKEYAARKQETNAGNIDKSSGRWEKCPRCFGTGYATCSMCKGLGHITASSVGVYNSSGKTECPLCHGTKHMPCNQYGCENGWVWIAKI